jgi:hypothetical protein
MRAALVLDEVLDRVRHEGGLGVLVRGAVGGDLLAVRYLGPEPLLAPGLVLAYHLPRRAQDIAGRSVVLLELDHLRVGIVFVEAHDDAHIGPAPAVYGLVVVADDAQVAVFGGELHDEAVLREIDVLVFVHEHMMKAVLIAREDVGIPLEEPDDVGDQVVEVAGVILGQPDLVERVYASNDLVVGPAPPPIEVVAGRDEFVLRVAYLPKDARRDKLLRIQVQIAQAVLHECRLIGFIEDDEIPWNADGFAVLAQDTSADRVEGPHPQVPVLPAQETPQPLAHLPRRFVGESDCENVVGREAALPDEVSHAVGEHAGLATSRAGEYQQRALTVKDGISLAIVQSCEYGRIGGVRHAGVALCIAQWGTLAAIVAQGITAGHVYPTRLLGTVRMAYPKGPRLCSTQMSKSSMRRSRM